MTKAILLLTGLGTNADAGVNNISVSPSGQLHMRQHHLKCMWKSLTVFIYGPVMFVQSVW